MKPKITQEFLLRLLETKTISYVIEAAELAILAAPSKPHPPRMGSTSPTATEAENYVLLLNRYDAAKIQYDEDLQIYRLEREHIFEEIVKFIKTQAGLNTIPEQYRDKVWNRAYADGHSSGYYEVYLKLESLVDIFQ